MIKFKWTKFPQLSLEQLYEVLALRSKVFIIEQACFYQDIDAKDSSAIHLLGQEDDSLVAYLRLFPPTSIENYVVFGRVVVAPDSRNKGYAKKLLEELLDYCGRNFLAVPIKCSAQNYLKNFYEGFGFSTNGEVYVEDGIPHIEMIRIGHH